ncbi:MAG: hypothetical protein PHU78_07890, partial [Heliobacteriaceae bacterium]|nr:hypothetical protein [Heliobacteriaceae bacterium]
MARTPRHRKAVTHRRRKSRLRIKKPLQFLVMSLLLACVLGFIVCGIFAAYFQFANPPTFWRVLAGFSYRDACLAFLFATGATTILLILQAYFQLVSRRPPLNDGGFWRTKALMLSLILVFFVAFGGLVVKAVDAYCAFWDTAHPAQAEGRFLGRGDTGNRDIHLEIEGRAVTLHTPMSALVPTLQWQQKVIVVYGPKTRVL